MKPILDTIFPRHDTASNQVGGITKDADRWRKGIRRVVPRNAEGGGGGESSQRPKDDRQCGTFDRRSVARYGQEATVDGGMMKRSRRGSQRELKPTGSLQGS